MKQNQNILLVRSDLRNVSFLGALYIDERLCHSPTFVINEIALGDHREILPSEVYIFHSDNKSTLKSYLLLVFE